MKRFKNFCLAYIALMLVAFCVMGAITLNFLMFEMFYAGKEDEMKEICAHMIQEAQLVQMSYESEDVKKPD